MFHGVGCGNVSRSSGLAKTILQGTVKVGRRQGRQRKRWEDNIREWIGLEFGKSQRAVENREKWRKLVVKSCVVPPRPSGLRDKWGKEGNNVNILGTSPLCDKGTQLFSQKQFSSNRFYLCCSLFWGAVLVHSVLHKTTVLPLSC